MCVAPDELIVVLFCSVNPSARLLHCVCRFIVLLTALLLRILGLLSQEVDCQM